jgi:hypothetical protein
MFLLARLGGVQPFEYPRSAHGLGGLGSELRLLLLLFDGSIGSGIRELLGLDRLHALISQLAILFIFSQGEGGPLHGQDLWDVSRIALKGLSIIRGPFL